jgi:hypothetical protein
MKAQLDILFSTVMIFAIFLVIGLVIYVFTQVSNELAPIINTTQAGKTALKSQQKVNATFANAIVLIYFALCIATFLSAFITESSPFFSILIFFLIPIQILVSFVFHDLFLEFVNVSVFSFVTSNFYVQSLFLYLPSITLVVSVIALVIIYAK